MSTSGGRAYWLVGAGVAAVAAAGAVAYWQVRAGVAGGSAPERIESIRRIATDRPPGAVEALALSAGGDQDARVRQVAMVALVQLARPEGRGAIETGAADPDAAVRRVAAGGLGLYADRRAADLLTGLVRADADPQVRQAAMQALARCDEDPRSIVVLLELAEHAPAADVRLHAMKALAGRLRAELSPSRRPEDAAAWRDLIERIKRMTVVQQAHAAMSAPLVRHPGDILGADQHPERRAPTTPDRPPQPPERRPP